MTLREHAQFIDELSHHYRRLDGFLVRHSHKYSLAEQTEATMYMVAIRTRLFGGIGDPNWPPPVNQADLERAARALLSWPPLPKEPEERRLRIVPMSVHDPSIDDRTE